MFKDHPRVVSSKKKKHPWKSQHHKLEYPSSQAAPEGHHEKQKRTKVQCLDIWLFGIQIFIVVNLLQTRRALL